MFNNQTILITGGTGSFGHDFIKLTLSNFSPKKVIIFSRDEMKQWEMAKLYKDDERVRFFIGDVRDKDRLHRALDGVDYVVHAAATKIVPTAEYNPFECIKTNVNGGMNIIDACLDSSVKKLVALSTDKACSPINLYGATKLASDKMFIAANSYSGKNKCKFSVVRYGNVMGSRGSIIPYFVERAKNNLSLTITDTRMTRFLITLEAAVNIVWHAFEDMVGGELYIKKIPSMNILDIAKAVSAKSEIEINGIRPGEKLHEQMISQEDSFYTYEYEDYYKVLPSINDWFLDKRRIKFGKKVEAEFKYSSDTNNHWLKVEELRKWIKNNYDY